MPPEDHRHRGRAPAAATPAGETRGGLSSRHRVAFAALLLVALGLRTAFFVASLSDPAPRQLEEDSHGYLVLAASLAAGHGFARVHGFSPGAADEAPTPELTRTPGYPVALAAIEALAPAVVPATLVAQHLAGIGLGVAVAVACARRFGMAPALAAAALLAFDVQGAALGNLILTETFFCALLAAAALLAPRLWDRPAAPRAAAVGLLLALAAFVKPTALALPGLLALALLAAAFRRGRACAAAALVLGATAYVPVAAWMARNARQSGRYVFSLIPRYQLLAEHAAAALARDSGMPLEQARAQLVATLGIAPARVRYAPLFAEEEARVRELALGTIRAHFGAFVRESALRSLNMLLGPDKNALKVFGLDRFSLGVVGRRGGAAAAPKVAWVLLGAQTLHVLAVYALVALALYRGGSAGGVAADVWIWLACAGGILALSLGTPGDPRYRWPVLPLLIAAGASGLGRSPRTVAA
jgi:hypothetical protein